MKLRQVPYIIAATLVFAISAWAQDETPQNATAWYGYEGYHPFVEGKPWGLMLEGYVKRNEIITEPQGLFYRAGLNYELKNGDRITGGYAYQYNNPYDSKAEPYGWSDHRIWEQYLWRRNFGKDKHTQLVQRFRVEHRWLQRKEAPQYDRTETWKFENTFRYQLKFNTPVSKNVSLSFYDEIHLRLSPRDEKLADQNRLYGGLIFYLDEKRLWRLETGYMLQSVLNSGDNEHGLKRTNHTLRVTITSDVPFRKRH
jgi:hypothetical protein